jgi:hypothetical protein
LRDGDRHWIASLSGEISHAATRSTRCSCSWATMWRA